MFTKESSEESQELFRRIPSSKGACCGEGVTRTNESGLERGETVRDVSPNFNTSQNSKFESFLRFWVKWEQKAASM